MDQALAGPSRAAGNLPKRERPCTLNPWAADWLVVPGTDRIEIRLLGRFAVLRGAEEVSPGEFGGRLVRTLVRILVSRRGQFVSKDELVEALWPERPPADPNRNLEILLVRARRALGDHSLILTRPGGYSFAQDDRCEVDAEIFLAKVEAGRRHLAVGKNRPALRSLEQALAKWSGDPFPEDAYAEWAQEYRSVLERAISRRWRAGLARPSP